MHNYDLAKNSYLPLILMEVQYHQGICLGHSFKKVKIEGYIEDIFDIAWCYFAILTCLIACALCIIFASKIACSGLQRSKFFH